MTLPYKDAEFIVWSDFDGTITMKDSNDYLTDNLGMGLEARRALNLKVLSEELTFRDAFRKMLNSVSTPFLECQQELVESIQLDPGFASFYDYCLNKNIPVVILSSGMEPLIRALLEKLVGPKASKIEIVCNQVDIKPGGDWDIVYHDDSGFGHDKSLAIRPYQQLGARRPTMFYCGDGVSDLSAARETDLLFAKAGHDLITYCEKENVPYKVFESFQDIHATVQSIVEGKTDVKTVSNVAK